MRGGVQRQRPMVAAAAANVPSTHYYYANQSGCVTQQPSYVVQQLGYVMQQPGYVVQHPACARERGGGALKRGGGALNTRIFMYFQVFSSIFVYSRKYAYSWRIIGVFECLLLQYSFPFLPAH